MSPPMQIPREITRLAADSCRLLGALAVGAMLTACAQSAQDANAAHAMHEGKPTATVTPLKAVPGVVDPDLVSAVSPAGASTTPISMKFKLGARPIVTTPLPVTVSLTTASDVAIRHILVSFQPGDGLQLQSERSFDVTDPSPDQPIQRELTVVPQQDGVLTLDATVLVDTDTGSVSRTYSIPLIASHSHS